MSLFLRQNRFGEDIRFGSRLFNFKPQAKIQKSTSKIHLHICLELFWTVYSCKQCLICAYFSPDADENVFFREINILEDCFKLKCLNDGFVSYKQRFTSQDVNWWTGDTWITCGLLWCFYQLFGLSFWRHPFTAEDPLVSKWCNATFLQICSDEETNSSTSRME